MRHLLAPSVLVLLGCAGALDALDSTPATVTVEAPVDAILDGTPVALAVNVATESGKALPAEVGKLTWSVTPAGVAEIVGTSLRCTGTGDASVLVTGAGVSTTFTARCRLVASIQAPAELILLKGEPEVPVAAAALDGNGVVIADVTPSLASSSPDVFEARDGAAYPRAVGKGTLTVSAGAARAEVPVTVMDRIKTDSLALADGASVTYTLTRGNYLVDVNVAASDGSEFGVTVTAVGGGCESAVEATVHRFECQVPDTTSVVITNPTSFGLGPSAVGNLSIYQIP